MQCLNRCNFVFTDNEEQLPRGDADQKLALEESDTKDGGWWYRGLSCRLSGDDDDDDDNDDNDDYYNQYNDNDNDDHDHDHDDNNDDI